MEVYDTKEGIFRSFAETCRNISNAHSVAVSGIIDFFSVQILLINSSSI